MWWAFTHIAESKSPLWRWTQAGITKNNNDDITHTILNICNYRRPLWRWELLSRSYYEYDTSWCLCTELGRRSQAPIFSTSLPPLRRRSDGEFKVVDTVCYSCLNTAFSAQTATAKLSTPPLVSNSYANYLKQFLYLLNYSRTGTGCRHGF